MKINKILLEDDKTNNQEQEPKLDIILPGNEEKQKIIERRIVKVLRIAKDAREAAKKARANSDDETAKKLEEEAEQLEQWADNNINLDDEEQNSETTTTTIDDDSDDDEDNTADDDSNDGQDDAPDESQEDEPDESQDNEPSSESGGSSDDGLGGANTPLENPFDLIPKSMQASEDDIYSLLNPASTLSVFDAMQKVLGKLRGGEAAGAKAALNDILKARAAAAESDSKQEALQEKLKITKTIDEIDEDSFNDIVNQALDNIDKVTPVDFSNDREIRVKEIKKDLDSPMTQNELSREDRINLAGGGEKIRKDRARAQEINKYRLDRLPSTDQFKLDLYDAIYDQVDRVKKQKKSWGAINRRHQNDDIVVPGNVIRGELDEAKPVIQVYLDCSASFNPSDIQKERALLSVLAEFEDRNEIETQIYYFANDVFDNYYQARQQSGTAAWPDIMDQIIDTNPANVLIVTDDDMERRAKTLTTHYRVDGCVWYIWKGSRAETLPKRLDGATGLKEYVINW